MNESSLISKRSTVLPRSENILSWSYWFGEIDTRSLSVFRIILGLLMLKDALYHLPLARIFYSDDGMIPRWALFDGLVRANRFSLMDSMGQPWMAALFFVVWIIVLILLIVGYRVRLITILNFIIILSVHERNGYILTAADTLMRAMCFWMMFAPVGQYYSIDAIRRRWRHYRETGQTEHLRVETKPRTAFALPMRLIQMQLVIVYISTAYLKSIGDIWQRGETMHYIVQIDTFVLPLGEWMRSWSPEMLKALSYFSMYAEVAIPILLLLPFVWRWSRPLAFILALMLHGGIAVTLSIQDFSILMLICYIPFFDPAWFKWLETRFNRDRNQITLPKPVDDNNPLWMWLSLTTEQQLNLSDATQSASKTDNWYIDSEGERFEGNSAWKRITAHLAYSRFWDWLLNIKPIRVLFWRIMGATVIHFQNKHYQVETQQNRRNHRLALSIVLIPTFALVIMWNIEATGNYLPTGFEYPKPVQRVWNSARNIVWYTGLWQYWDMFSPVPIQYDGWLVIEGNFENEISYDLLTEQTLDYEQPTRWYWGPDMRFEKFEENVYKGRYDALLRGIGRYYCRTVNENRIEGTRLATIRIVMVYVNFHAPNEFPQAHQQDQLWFHWCYDEFAPQS